MSLHGHDAGSFELALRALGEEEGTSEQARALEQRLLDTLGADALGAPVATASAGLSRLWLMLGIGLLIGMGALIVRPQRSALSQVEQVGSVEPARTIVSTTVSTIAAPSARTLESPAQSRAEPAVEPVPATKPPTTRRNARRVASPQALATARTPPAMERPLEGELSLLQRSRAALRRDPGVALLLTEQHAQDYPAGLFVQEREMLAVEALLKQRRTHEAIARADRFVTEHASSAYAPGIRAMLAMKPRGSAARPDGAP
jgi:hypothetical protein